MTNDDIWHWQHRFELGCIFGARLDPECKTGRSETPLASAWPCSTCSSCSSRSPPLLHADPHHYNSMALLKLKLMQIPITSTAWPCSSGLCRSPPPLLLPDHPAQCPCWPPHHNCWQIPPPPLHAHACPWWSPIFLATFMASRVCDAISQHTTRDICNFPVNFHIKENKPTMTKDWKISSATVSKNFLLAKSVHFPATHIYHLCRQSWVGEEVIGIGGKVQKVKVKVKKWNRNDLITFMKVKKIKHKPPFHFW